MTILRKLLGAGLASLVAFGASTVSAAEVEVLLCAGTFDKTLDDGQVVEMWGFGIAPDFIPVPPELGDDLVFPDTCSAPEVELTSPGPIVEAMAGDDVVFRVYNGLNDGNPLIDESVSVIVPSQNLPGYCAEGFPTACVPSAGTPEFSGNRVTSFVQSTATGEIGSYTLTGVREGTYAYTDGTHAQLGVAQGLHGPLWVHDPAGNVFGTDPADTDVLLYYYDVDSDIHAAVAEGNWGTPGYTSMINYHPDFLGVETYGTTPIATNGTPIRAHVRLINNGYRNRAPGVDAAHLTYLAEDGYAYPHDRTQYSGLLPAGKTRDAIVDLSSVVHAFDVTASAYAYVALATAPDLTPPFLTAQADITAEATEASGAVVNFVDPTATDEDPPNPIVTCDPLSGTLFALGDTPVTCSAADTAGNVGETSFTVSVLPSESPVLVVPADITQEATSPAGNNVNFAATATDNVDPDPAVDCSPASGSLFGIATTQVNCTATDAVGNVSTGAFNVTVQDTIAPSLEQPDDVAVESAVVPAAVNYPVPGATDAADANPDVNCLPASGSSFAEGDTLVTCTATDNSGNFSEVTFTVSVTEQTVNNTIVVTRARYAGFAGGSIEIRATSALGSAANLSVVGIGNLVWNGGQQRWQGPSFGSWFFGIGANPGQITVFGPEGSVTVQVLTNTGTPPVLGPDTTPPTFVPSPPPDVTAVSIIPVAVNYPLPTVTDNVDPNPTVVCVPASGSVFNPGSTQVDCTATDSEGNAAQDSFDVNVIAVNNTLVVTRARYRGFEDTLQVRVTSDLDGSAGPVTVTSGDGTVNYGNLVWNAGQNRWQGPGPGNSRITNVPVNPGTITVTAPEGSVTVQVLFNNGTPPVVN